MLSLKLYKLNKEEKSKATATKKEKDDVSAPTAGEVTEASGSDVTTQHPFHGLDEETRECFKVRNRKNGEKWE